MDNILYRRKARRAFFRLGSCIGPAYIANILRAALVARANVADTEARAVLDDIVDDAAHVVTLCWRGAP